MTENQKQMVKFKAQLDYVKDTSFKRAFKYAAKEVADRLVENTPRFFRELDTSGRTKANWNITFYGNVGSQYNENIADFDGDETKSRLKSEIEAFKMNKDTVITFYNATPWINKLEYGGYPVPSNGSTNPVTGAHEIRTTAGFSNQAPLGIVIDVELNWTDIAQTALSMAVRG